MDYDSLFAWGWHAGSLESKAGRSLPLRAGHELITLPPDRDRGDTYLASKGNNTDWHVNSDSEGPEEKVLL